MLPKPYGANTSYNCLLMTSKLQLYHVLYNNLYTMCVINSMTLSHYVTAGIDCMGGTCFVLMLLIKDGNISYGRVYQQRPLICIIYIFSKSKDISCILLPFLLHWQQTGIIFSEVQFRFQKPTQSEDMAAIFPRTYGIAYVYL